MLGESTVPVYAREVATEPTAKDVSADRTSVNQALYGTLQDRVHTSAGHRWRLVASAGDTSTTDWVETTTTTSYSAAAALRKSDMTFS